jgi:uncharacterized protein
LSPDTGEAMIVVSRRIRPGRQKEYSDWLRRVIESAHKFPGYRGVTTLSPQGFDSDVRYLIWRFDNQQNLENWEKSGERAVFLAEVKAYADQFYEKASGMETWFELPDMHRVVAPPRWKMFIVTMFAVVVVSFVARSLLGPFIGSWPLIASILVYSVILVGTLTYFAMPQLSRLLRKWLYSKTS